MCPERSVTYVSNQSSKYAPFGALFYFVCHFVDHFLLGRATAFRLVLNICGQRLLGFEGGGGPRGLDQAPPPSGAVYTCPS